MQTPPGGRPLHSPGGQPLQIPAGGRLAQGRGYQQQPLRPAPPSGRPWFSPDGSVPQDKPAETPKPAGPRRARGRSAQQPARAKRKASPARRAARGGAAAAAATDAAAVASGTRATQAATARGMRAADTSAGRSARYGGVAGVAGAGSTSAAITLPKHGGPGGPGGPGRGGPTRAAEGSPMLGRAMLALTLVLALTVPVALFLLWDRGVTDQSADNKLPISTFSDDKFRTVGNTPPTKAHTPSPTPSNSPTPSDTPSETPSEEPTQTPSESRPPTADPSQGETVAPTRIPTSGPTRRPTRTPSTTAPTSQPTTTAPPPPPADDGNMSAKERELFNLINDARVDHGCNAARPDSGLSGSARTYAGKQAKGGDNQPGDGTDATSASSSAQRAFNDMMNRYSGTLLDCGRTRLGIGYADRESCLLVFCSTNYSWVADFGG